MSFALGRDEAGALQTSDPNSQPCSYRDECHKLTANVVGWPFLIGP
jgi:hypothetical protein